MAIVKVEKNNYTVEPLYQWDLNQELEIYGLSLASIPEVHFTNVAMDRAIVRQASMDAAGVVRVDVPNSLLQKPYKIVVYVCTYAGATLETQYKLELPVKARTQPADYTLVNDPEVYSFNALENQVLNMLIKADNTVAAANAAVKAAEAEVVKANNAVKEAEKIAGETADEINAQVDDMLAVSDETKALYGLTPQDGVDDMFLELSDADNKIGDIKITARTDLGSNWILCNGDCASKNEYPELAAILTASFGRTYIENVKPPLGSVKCVTYADGYWVVGGLELVDSTYYARIAYSTSLDGEWTVKDLWSSTGTCSVKSLAYANGYWVAGGQYRTSADGYCHGYIAYATSLDGDWTTQDLWSANGSSYTNVGVNSVLYANGYWVAGGTNVAGYSYARLAYATSPDGTWKTKDAWSHSNSSCMNTEGICLAYADGYWVFGGLMDSGNKHSYIAYTTDPSGTWTIKNLGLSSNSSTTSTWPVVRCVTYENGYWVFGVLGRLYYSTSLDGEYKSKSLFASSDNIRGVVYADGMWMAAGTADDGNIKYSASLDGTWKTKDIWRTGTSTNGLVNTGGKWVATGALTIAYADGNGQLPTVTHDNAYGYIKAKE